MRGIVEFGFHFFPSRDGSLHSDCDGCGHFGGAAWKIRKEDGDDDEEGKMDMETLRQSDGKSQRFGQDKMPAAGSSVIG